MNVKIVFSPTGGTAKVADILTKNWNGVECIDLTKADKDFSECQFNSDDRALIAMPSYGGLAPEVAIERFKKISGNGAKCTIVCVYGNRAYEDTLVQMEDVAKECGFDVIAAVAAVAEHQLCISMPQVDRMQMMKNSLKPLQNKSQSKKELLPLFPVIVLIKKVAVQVLFLKLQQIALSVGCVQKAVL